MKATSQTKTDRFHTKQMYIKFYQKEILKHYNLPFNRFVKIPYKRRLFLALKVMPATAKTVSISFRIPVESLCRKKRSLELSSRLQTSRKRAICPITKHRAFLLTTDENLFNSKYFGCE